MYPVSPDRAEHFCVLSRLVSGCVGLCCVLGCAGLCVGSGWIGLRGVDFPGAVILPADRLEGSRSAANVSSLCGSLAAHPYSASTSGGGSNSADWREMYLATQHSTQRWPGVRAHVALCPTRHDVFRLPYVSIPSRWCRLCFFPHYSLLFVYRMCSCSSGFT
jgi:hypothetical protein